MTPKSRVNRPKIEMPAAAVLESLQGAVPAEENEHLASIRAWIAQNTGLYFSEKKSYTLYRRLQKVCWRMGLADLEELDRQLHSQNSTSLAVEVVCAVSTNHTFFFRELEVLQQIPDRIMPQLPRGGEWRFWSAASASGEEAFTLSILIAETLRLAEDPQKVAILGTDISHPMIETAERGVYEAGHLELVPPDVLRRYFEPAGPGRWRVNPALKQMCTFRRMNLQSMPWPFKNQFHVIVCRNVLYYFAMPEQKRLLEEMYDHTAPGGWLVTSVTETVAGQSTRWSKVDVGLFRKN